MAAAASTAVETAAPQEEPQCEVCLQQPPKYTCPGCQKRTCSLDCVKAHKAASGCSGKRDRTAFMGRAAFDERTLLSDYRFLEEVKLADDVAKRSKPAAPKYDMPQFLQTLMHQARRRGVQLHILSPGMEKRRTNTTRYDGRMQLLHWHIEWSFPAVGIKVADSKVHENRVMAELLRAHLALRPGEAARHHAVREYNEAGLEQLTVLLRKERTPANAAEYFEIDISRPLRQQLAGKVIVEFPTFLVLLPRERGDYRILPAPPAPAAAGAAAGVAAAAPAGGAATAAAAAGEAEAGGSVEASAASGADAAAEPAAAAAGEAAGAAQGHAAAAAAPPPSEGPGPPAGAAKNCLVASSATPAPLVAAPLAAGAAAPLAAGAPAGAQGAPAPLP